MRGPWPLVRLGEVAALKYGFNERAEENGTHRFVRITDIDALGALRPNDKKYVSITEGQSEYVLSPGDILMARTGATYGKCLYFEGGEPSVFAGYLIKVSLMEKVLPKYFWIFSQSSNFDFQKKQLVMGGAQPQFNANTLKKVVVPIPPLDVQREIIAIIEEAFQETDAAIANSQASLALTGDLLPSYLSHSFDPSWPLVKLGEICDIARGRSPRPIHSFLTDREDGINWIRMSDAAPNSKYIYRAKEKIQAKGVRRSRYVKEGDCLLSNSMNFGRPYILKTDGCIHDGWLVLSNISGLCDREYLYYFLSSPAAYKQFNDRAAGSTVRNLNIDLVRSVQVPLPPLDIQREIVHKLEQVSEASSGLEQLSRRKLAAYGALKSSLLAQAFCGKLTAAPPPEPRASGPKGLRPPEPEGLNPAGFNPEGLNPEGFV